MTAYSGSSDTPLYVETITDGETTRIVIRGEADIINVSQLDAMLTGIELVDTKSVHLDASDLAFVDLAALRCLIAFADTVKQAGRDFTTCAATPLLHDVARVLELQDELGLR